ncbi:MAG: ferrous iron transporter B, partial [Deltaproteobacteria bacterium]|nr:ferrous iron transporter B [Deltaproteobacteria bacterium]
TGHHAQVSNYPGSTVDHRVGHITVGTKEQGSTIDIVDVPGTYTLNARSDDERIAIAELLGHTGHPRPDAAIVVLRYATLQRGLYFLMQVQELGIPLIAVVNMMDESRSRGCPVDLGGLTEHFGIPFVGTVATSREGIDGVRQAIIGVLAHKQAATNTWHWHPSDHLAGHLDEIAEVLDDVLEADASIWRRRAFALWCLMSLGDLPAGGRRHKLMVIPDTLRDRTIDIRASMVAEGHDLDLEVTRARYAHIDRDIDQHGWKRPEDRRGSTTEKVDAVLTHPVWGTLVFLVTISLIFAALFDWATPIVDGISGLFTQTAQALRSTLPAGLVTNFLADGVLMGVGAVLAFLPQILILFFFIALLESSGYMARVAFLTDRAMRKIGLHGGALVPLISGFACAVPAIMATRTIPRHRDRLLTIMVLPLISCSARLPVYTLLISA